MDIIESCLNSYERVQYNNTGIVGTLGLANFVGCP